MSKEYLEAFNRIVLHTECDNDSSYDCLCFEDDCKLVDSALQRLEQIDNSKKDINSLYSNMHQTSDELDKSLKDSLLKNAKIEAIDNADPSEALDYINCFLNEMTYCLEHPKEYVKGYEKEIFYKYKYTFETTIKQALTTKHKKELAWDIVVKKNVDIALLKREKSVDSYNFCASLSPIKRDELTKKEFNLLKEVVK